MRTRPVYDGDRFNAVRLFRVISEDSAERDSLDESCAFLIEGAHCSRRASRDIRFAGCEYDPLIASSVQCADQQTNCEKHGASANAVEEEKEEEEGIDR